MKKNIVKSGFLFIQLAFLVMIVQSAEWKIGPAINVVPNPLDGREQINPRVAFDGDSLFLIVWQQGGNLIGERFGDIYAARMDIHGRVLDNTPLVICAEEGLQESPRVVNNGHCFLVVWSDLRDGKQWDVYGARVMPSGQILDVGGFVIAGGIDTQQNSPDIVENGDSAFTIAYQAAYALPGTFYRAAIASVWNNGRVVNYGDLPNIANDPKGRGSKLWGGDLSLAHLGDTYFLKFLDHKSSIMGSGNQLMQIVTFKIEGGALTTTGRSQPCYGLLHNKCAFATDGERTAFLVNNTTQTPRGGNVYGYPVAMFFTSASGVYGIKNPNADGTPGFTGWICSENNFFFPYGINPPKTEHGMVGAAYFNGYFLMASRGGGTYAGNDTMQNKVWLSRLYNQEGQAFGSPYCYNRNYVIYNPTLSASKKGYLLVCSEQASTEICRISAQFVQDTLLDTVKPVVTQALSTDTNHVKVVFSEVVEKVSAETIANYSISNSVTVLSATLQADKVTVILTTSSLIYNTQYALTVSNVSDQAITPNTMNIASMNFTCVKTLVISNINQAGYVWDVLANGKVIYNDAPWTFGVIPAKYVGLNYLKTSNSNATITNSSASFLSFNVSDSVVVYVGYDARNSSIPSWLTGGFSDVGDKIDNIYALYSKRYGPGTVTLSGCQGSINYSMYTVIIKPVDSTLAVGTKLELPDVEEDSCMLATSPNPFNPSVTISVSGWNPGSTLKILDVCGQVVANLVQESKTSVNRRQVVWNAAGHASGVYVVVLKNKKTELKRKVLLIR